MCVFHIYKSEMTVYILFIMVFFNVTLTDCLFMSGKFSLQSLFYAYVEFWSIISLGGRTKLPGDVDAVGPWTTL